MRIPLYLVFCFHLSASASALIPYLFKQGFKQGSLILRAQEVAKLLKNENLDPRTERFLKLSQEVLAYAENHAGMKTGKSYRSYLDIGRPWVTQIVMAAHKDKLEPYLFEYPVLGALPYKGFFDEADAVALEKELMAQGLDTYRRPVDAFSTLGWIADPLLSTMFTSEGRLIETLFHELTHLNFYFKGEADFNEAFASWMGYELALEFLASKPKFVSDAAAVAKNLSDDKSFQTDFALFVRKILSKGKEFYAQAEPFKQREAYFAWIRKTAQENPRFARIENKNWNNAVLLSLGTYYELVPKIEAYANTQKLSPKDFLAAVVKTGAPIVPQILGTK